MMNYNLKQIYDWPLIPRSIVIGIICCVVFYLGYFLDLSGTARKLKLVRQQEEDLKIQFVSLASSVADTKKELTKYPRLINALSQTKKKLINSSELPELLNEILKMGAQNELEFNNFSPGAEVKEGEYVKVPIKVVVVGTYDQIASFISQVANMDRIVAVGNFVLAKNQIKTPTEPTLLTNRLIGELTLEVYEAKGGA